jgi:hypothetical protein
MTTNTWRRGVLALVTGAALVVAVGCAADATGSAPSQAAGAPAPAAVRSSEAAPKGGSADSGQPQPNVVDTRMIVYTAQVGLRVGQVGTGIERLTAIANQYGGFVSASSRSESGTPTATVTLRVPAPSFSQAMADIRASGDRVLSENITSQDVTEQFADLNAQLRSLQATEAQYLELLRRANTVEDILKVQQQLTTIRTQIERIQGQINAISRRADLATITVTLTERPPVPVGDVWEPGRVIEESFTASLLFLQQAATAVLRITVFFWWLCLPALILVAIVAVLSRRGRKPRAGQSG